MKDNPRKLVLVLIATVAVVAAVAGVYAFTRDGSTHASMAETSGMAGMEGMDHSSGMALETNGQPYDQAFIDNMVPHHEGAVEMARIELAKGKRADVKKLAAQVISAQNSEIERMKEWRNEWFGDSSTPAEMPMSMPGMDVEAVRDAKDVDRAFVEMMIPHHESAIAMATDAKTKGTHAEIRDLAAAIVTDQQREIVQMEAWLESW
jgi:uncharacterized protein (DUF305 family)